MDLVLEARFITLALGHLITTVAVQDSLGRVTNELEIKESL